MRPLSFFKLMYLYIYIYIFSSPKHKKKSRPFTLDRCSTTGLFETNMMPAPSRLLSSVGSALHRYHIGHGFKSRTGLIFFSGLILTTAQVVFITAKNRFQIHVFIRSSNMTFIYSHSFNNNDNNKNSIIKGQNFNNNIIPFFNDVCNEKGG